MWQSSHTPINNKGSAHGTRTEPAGIVRQDREEIFFTSLSCVLYELRYNASSWDE